jgi:hypothetical protein
MWFYVELNIQPYLKQGVNNIAIRLLRFYQATPHATSVVRLPLGGLYICNGSSSNDIDV